MRRGAPRQQHLEERAMTNHNLDYGEIDEVDEISGDEQLVLIWCRAHHTYEWHWIEMPMEGKELS
jgi:hypothetical protein